MAETNHDACSICLRPRQKSGSGSLTQWINYCRCQANVSEGALDGALENTVITCKVCTKRINEGRSGSLTQWIFAEHICKCKVPQPIMDSSNLLTGKIAINGTKRDRTVAHEEERIEVDETLFPIDRYRPLKFLGQGALGQVYLCRDLSLGKKVAVKSLMGLTDDRVVSFQQEAKIVSRLNHENIIKVFDFGTASGGRPFMVMEYFDGNSLQEVLANEGRLNEYEARAIFSGICDALYYLHEHKIFHRDLKPSNILIGQNDIGSYSIRLIDFGLSKTTQDVQSKTFVQGRTVVGTPSYMSPDQVSGLEYDAKSEIYSLGCVMYEALSGELPFTGETSLEILNKHLTASFPSPKQFSPDLSNEICDITLKCLNKSREKRFKSVREILEAIGDTTSIFSNAASLNDSPASPFEDSQTNQLNRFDLGLKSSWPFFAGAVAFVGIISALVVSILTPTMRDEDRHPLKVSYDTIGSVDTGNLVNEQTDELKQRFRLNLLADKQTLDLREMCNDDDLRVLQGKESVENINLWGSPITDKAFQYLAKLPNLTRLELTRTNVTTLRGLNEVKKLRFLNLSATKVDDAALDNIVKIKDLKELDLSSTTITDRGVAKLAGLEHLVTLKLKKNRNIGPGSIKALKSMKTLPQVDLSDTKVSMSDIEDLARSNLALQTIVFTGTTSEYEILESRFPTITFSPDRLSQVAKWGNIASLKLAKGKHAAALEPLKKIVAAVKLRPNSFKVSAYLAQMCICYFALRQYDKAEKMQLSIFQTASAENDEKTKLFSLISMFNINAKKGDKAKTEKLGQQVLKQSAKVNGRPSNDDADIQFNNIICWYANTQQIDKCYRATKQVLKDYKRLYGGLDVGTAAATVVEAKCLEQLGRGKEAYAKLGEALKLFSRFDPEKMTDIQVSQLGDGYIRLIRLTRERKEYESALAMTDEALRVLPTSKRAFLIVCHKERIAILNQLNRKKEAEQDREVLKKLVAS